MSKRSPPYILAGALVCSTKAVPQYMCPTVIDEKLKSTL